MSKRQSNGVTARRGRFCDSLVSQYGDGDDGCGTEGPLFDRSQPHVINLPDMPQPPAGGRFCRDVTTYDQNWFNDMLCTREDGSRFYTDYAGANAFLGY